MSEWITNLVSHIRAFSPARQAVLGATALGSLAFFFWLASGAARPEYRGLYRGLPEDEVARVADALKNERIPYRLADGGTSVEVPASQIYEARIRVAAKGLPSGGAVGFELFDKPAFGVTDFVHKVNYARAIQGELARSIEQLDSVERARVQVVMPDHKSVLSAHERKASAAVVVKLLPGRELGSTQVRAVVHLVASSIEALDPKDVTVVDGAGRLLAPQGEGGPDSGSMSVGGAPGYQQRVEAELAKRIESMLEKTVGIGNVIARVRADMDWTQSETTQETYDPDSQVARSEQHSTEKNDEISADEGGVPGVVSNTPDSTAAVSQRKGPTSTSTHNTETLNYEISKTVSHKVKPMGQIQRLSVAVLVADRPGKAEGDDPVPWSAEDLKLFKSLAQKSVGFNERRGDEITVSSAPFRLPATRIEEPDLLTPELLLLLLQAARILSVMIAVVLFARLVVKPVAAVLRSDTNRNLPRTVAELQGNAAIEGLPQGVAVSGAMAAAAGRSTEPAPPAVPTDEGVRAIRNWLNQG